MNPEIKRELALRVHRLGESEYKLAVSKSENSEDINQLAVLIEQHRQPYTEGKATNMGSAMFASPDAWIRIAEESEAAAKRELLSGTADLSELQRLERAADEARKLADAKNAELNKLYDELSAIPLRLTTIGERLASLRVEADRLNSDSMKAEFKARYAGLLNGDMTQAGFADALAIRLYTADLRREVLAELTAELSAEASRLEARKKQLSKRLNGKA